MMASETRGETDEMFRSKTLRKFDKEHGWEKFARAWLRDALKQCSDGEHLLFKKMYAKGRLHASIDEVVDDMDEDKLDTAVDQVERTLEKHEKAAGGTRSESKPEHEVVGEAFVVALHEEMSKDDFLEMRRRQKTPEYGGTTGNVCASHDFVDSNVTMERVMTAHGHPTPPRDENDETIDEAAHQAHCELWGAAWKHAVSVYVDPVKLILTLPSKP